MSGMLLKKHRFNWYIIGGAAALLLIVATFTSFKQSPRILISSASIHDDTDSDALLDHIKNATLGFEKIFVINLPSRTDHRDSIALAGSLTGLEFEFVDGVTNVDPKTVPPSDDGQQYNKGELGNWRAHMTAARLMIEKGITTALILEDDADWDIRIHDIMRNYAKATRLLVQPVARNSNEYLDPTYPNTSFNAQTAHVDLHVDEVHTSRPIDSPYGNVDNWDMLWIGHCGTTFPPDDSTRISTGRAVISHDDTVPEPQHIHMQFGDDALVRDYPAHTRVVSRASNNLCTLGYALTLNGARKAVYELGVHHMLGQTDVAFRKLCDGSEEIDVDSHVCMSVQPQIFQHHRPVGSKSSYSDISEHDEEVNEVAYTRNVRWSTRLNLNKLINKQTDYVDLFKDGEEYVDYGFG